MVRAGGAAAGCGGRQQLGSLYTNPTRGKPDLVQAPAWFKHALRDGSRELAATVAANLRTIEDDMTPT